MNWCNTYICILHPVWAWVGGGTLLPTGSPTSAGGCQIHMGIGVEPETSTSLYKFPAGPISLYIVLGNLFQRLQFHVYISGICTWKSSLLLLMLLVLLIIITTITIKHHYHYYNYHYYWMIQSIDTCLSHRYLSRHSLEEVLTWIAWRTHQFMQTLEWRPDVQEASVVLTAQEPAAIGRGEQRVTHVADPLTWGWTEGVIRHRIE